MSLKILSKVAASLQAQLSGNEAPGMMGEDKCDECSDVFLWKALDNMLKHQMQIDWFLD